MSAEARAILWRSREHVSRRLSTRDELAERVARVRARRMNQRAISGWHAAILVLGIVTFVFGLFYLVVAGGFFTPTPIVAMVLAVILILIGVSETLVESETGRRSSR